MTDAGQPHPEQNRVPVAIVAPTQTPYRIHAHRRIAEEIPEIRLHSVFTHEINIAPWPWRDIPEIGTICFGRGERGNAPMRPRRLLRDWRRGGRILRWMRERGVRAALVCGYRDIGKIRIIFSLARRGVPVFFVADSNVHGDRATGLKRLVKRLLLTRLLRRCAGVMPCGSAGEAYFQRYGVPVERMFRFPYEPDYSLVQELPEAETRAALERFSLDPARRRFVYSGRLAEVKRVDILVRAFVSIARERPEWDLLLIGDGALRQRIEGLVPADLRHRVTITGFLTDQRLVSALYRGCDALVLPSDYEPWGLVINEAAGAGLAIVATNIVGAAIELVEDGVSGRLIPPRDESALRDALLQVSEPGRTEQMQAATERVLDRWRREADPVEGLRSALRWCGALPAAERSAETAQPYAPAGSSPSSP